MTNTVVDQHPTSGSEPGARGFYFSKQFAPADVEQSIPARFEAIVARNPSQIAVQTANQALTYADLNAQVNRIAHRIIAERGVRAEPVALWFERSDALAASVLGVLKAGRFVVLLDPLFPLSRIEATLEDSQAELMITDRQDPATLAGFRAAGRQILEFDGIDPESPPADPRLPISPADIAFIFYTSGSTGAPKGVVHSHRNVLHNVMLRTTAYEVFTHDRVSLLSSSTSNSIIITFLALLDGATLLPFDVRKEGVVRLGPWLRREKISVCRISGPLFRSLCETLRPEEKFPDLRVLRLTSETVYKTDVDLYKRHCAPHCVFVNGLSSSEAGLQRKYVVHFDTEIAGNEVPVGYPVIDKEIVLLDDDGNEAGVGEIGEIVVRSRYLSLGYWRKPELTAAKFKSDPNAGDARTFFSGDLAVMLADRCLIHKGRKDFKVKVRGYSVEPAEIEKALRAHDSIKDAVVLTRRHKSGEDRLTAYYTSSGSPAPKVSNLREFLSRKLPDYMVPSGFVSLQAMPLTSNGKIDRQALPDPASSRPDIATAYVAPRTGLEAKLAAIWVEVFGVDRVGVDDDFFALGGHSLLAARIIARTSEACRTELPLRTLFELGNIAKLAAWIEQATGPAQAASVAPIIPIARDRELPLSFAQQRLWFLDRLDPGSFAHNLQRVFRLKGRLNVDALEQSFNQIVERHEVLRTIIETVDGRPRQTIVPSATIKVSRVDFQGIAPEQNRQAEANRLCLEEARRPFDLAKGPLLRVMLLQLGADEHLLVRTLHHIVFDVWSMGILARELSTYYRCLTTGATPSLPPLEIQYADYASWQRQRWNDDALAGQRRYWKNLLDTLPPELELPADRPRPALPTARGRRCFFSLCADVLEQLKAVCEQKRATLFMVLAAAFQTLLQRYTGQEDILIGSPVAGRDRGEVENLIGFFLNLLPLRSDFSGNPTFLELVDRVREVCLGAFANQDLPFEKIVEEVQPERPRSYSPLFKTTFTLENTPGALLRLDGLIVEEVDGAEGVVRFDLECVMMQQGSGLRGFVSYDASLFEAPTIERMVKHFQNLLENIASDPDRRLSELALLSEAERHQLLDQCNDTQRDYPRDASMGELFEAQAERRGNAAAVVVEDQRLSYRELNRRANQCARYLRKIGVGPDVPVSICADASLHRIVGLLAILKAGGAYVPLDPEYPKARLAFMIEDCQAPVLLTQETLLSRLPAHGGQTVCLDRDWPEIAKERAENPDWKTPAESLAYVIYTSGSSGEPKGIAVPHRAVNHLVINTDYVELSRDDVIAQASNISFDAATFEIWGALLNGARLVVLCRDTLLSPPALAAAIERHGITTLFLTTALFNQMAERIPGALAKLNCLLFGGESADPQTVRALLEKAPPKRLLHVYGPTESTTFASWYWVKTLAADAPAVPIGKPIANTQIYILDPALNPVPAGVRGEIYIGGDGLARHYFNRPELSAARFIANPFSREPGARLYKTGDQARYLPDGNIEFIGRLDGQVKIRGHRIEPGEIEATLIQHPAVKECAVAAEQEPESGSEDNRRLAAYVAASETLAPTAHELRRFLKQKLPDYMIPSAFLFVETMPLTPNGKIDRKALPSVANKWPAALDTAQAAPKTITEETVAGIWLELLKLERVGMHENFFDLGGHSLLAIELLERIRRQFGIELPVRAIFDAPTVAGLAARLDAQKRGKLPDSIQIKNSFSFLVELHRGNGQAPLFMIPGGFGREDELLALGRLARAMGEDRRCYGMRARSAGRTEPAHSDVGEMAAEYLKEVRAVQPEGPYYLVGECVAGAVAYEMARQLRAGGQAVGVLALLDATCPNRVRYLKYRANLVLKKYIRRASRLLHGRNGSSRKNEKLRDRAHYKRISSPVVVGNERRGGKSNIPGWFQPSVKRSYLDVLQRCRPESYEGPLTLFYAKETNRQATIKKWKKLVPGAVEICYVPGDHETYIREHVDVLAKQLRLCLDKAAATSSDDSLREAGGPNLRHPGIVAVDQGAG